jgi:hypothetical protein
VSSGQLLNGRKKFNEVAGNLLVAAVCLVVFANITGCERSVTKMDLPTDFIKDFIAKHETMVDKSLIYYYVKSEQNDVAEQVNRACRISERNGRLESLENASFDFSDLKIELVDQKEDYVNDEPVVFVLVAVKGCYQMRIKHESKKIEANDIIVLQMAHNEWKVTNSKKPWI